MSCINKGDWITEWMSERTNEYHSATLEKLRTPDAALYSGYTSMTIADLCRIMSRENTNSDLVWSMEDLQMKRS